MTGCLTQAENRTAPVEGKVRTTQAESAPPEPIPPALPCKDVRSALPLLLTRPRWGPAIINAEHGRLSDGTTRAVPSAPWVEPIKHVKHGWGV